jgi:phenylacetate-coenzyme A ligase PaaK-like adenylate-forming protein
MFQINKIMTSPPFSITNKEKSILFNEAMRSLTNHHYQHCSKYKSIFNALKYHQDACHSYDQFPFLPVRLFKDYKLSSINKKKIFKTMHSSGTSGQDVSKIYLDKENAFLQTKVLTKIVSTVLGNKRLPMLIIDSKSTVKDRNLFTARGAGIIGFSIFGKDITYALSENMELDIEQVKDFLIRHKNEKIFIFGFTYIIWKYFVKEILTKNYKIPQIDGFLIHGGGWKKLAHEAVDNIQFKKSVYDASGVKNVINYYGMVEQTGSIFLECSEGYLHCSIFSDIIIRRNDFSICDFNEIGLVQLISLLPTSYPGHNIISEDIGEIIGIDDCKCDRLGKYFIIHGRAEKAEIRGCSDTVE